MANKTIIAFEQLKKKILSKEYSPIYFLHGEESYFIDELSDLLESTVLTPEQKGFNLNISYGKDISPLEIKMTCRRFPMGSQYQLIMVKEAQNIKNWDDMNDYFEKPNEHTILVICNRSKIDLRTKMAKTLAKFDMFAADQLRDYEITAWINDYIKSKNKSIDPKATEIIGQFVGTNLQKLKSEIDKMLQNIPKDVNMINIHHVEHNIGISKEYNIFELQNALGSKNYNKSIQITNYFLENIKPGDAIGYLYGLLNYFKKMYLCHDVKNKSPKEISMIIGVNEFFVKDYLLACRNYSKDDIEMILGYMKFYDLAMKGVDNASNSQGELFRELVVKIFKINDVKKLFRIN
ncbi:MAG: DNA polymerase III subunit delta [Bacteroidota bacterium]|nr:DNA polymerase III subunit delta [Bacteroidota bacterium]